jgi:hypothetical protein
MRLPVYEQQVRLQGRNRTDLTVRANPNAFGAQMGEAFKDLGAGIAKVAEAKVYKAALKDDADSRAGLNDYIDYTRDVLYDPNSGAMVQTGANALGENRKAAEERLAERRAQIAEKLGPGARKIFEQAADRLDDTAADGLIRKEGAELRDYSNKQFEATAENFLGIAMDNYDDDDKWNQYTNAAIAEVVNAGQLNGLPPEAISAKVQDIKRNSHGNRAIRIAYDDVGKADAYLDAHREDLGEAEYSRLKTGMEAAVVEHKAQKVIDDMAGGDGYIGSAGEVDALGRERYIVGPESGGNPNAKNPMPGQTATGSVQFTAGTYREWVRKVNPEWAVGLSDEEILATRTDPTKEAEIYRAFRDNNLAVLAKNGHADTPRNRYVMHHFGVGDGPKMLAVEAAGQGNLPLVDIVGQAVIDANPYLKGKTVSGALATLQGKVNAHGANGGLSARAAYEAVMAIEDPKVRDAALSKLDARLKAEEALSARDQKAAGDEAWRMYTQEGMRAQDVPMDLQIKMGREATLNFFESARAYESGTLVTDEVRYSELQRLAAQDQRAFVDLDLSYDRKNFSKGDYRALEQLQLEVEQQLASAEEGAQNVLDDPATMNKVYSAAEQRYNDMLPADGKRQGAEAAAYNRFQESVKRYSRDFMLEKGRPMTFDEQDRLFSMLLTPVLIGRPGVRSQREAMLFDAPFRNPGERVRGNQSAENVSLADEEEARAELLDFYGREPTEDEINVHYNRKVLADMGISPDITYGELPRDIRKKLSTQYPDASDEELVDLYVDFVLETARRE